MIKRKILFICKANQYRSPTAEWLYGRNDELLVMSAGVHPRAVNPISRELLEWADQIFVFEPAHGDEIRQFAPDLYGRLSIECLSVPDDYRYQDPQLISILKKRLANYLGSPRRDV